MVEKERSEEAVTQFQDELEWISEYNIPPRRGFDMILENPMVPLGCLATLGALIMGLKYHAENDHWKSLKMMKWRCGLQTVTLLAVLYALNFKGKPK